jgi:type VI secretion system protein ImpF
LLDRLTDEHPESKEESREQRVVSLRRYREGVLRDLSWLLNSSCPSADDPISDFPEVSRSVLNYGIPDLCGFTVSHISPAEIEEHLLRAVRSYEPRILRESLSVRAVAEADPVDENAVSFEIEGELWAQPMPDRLYIKTKFDLETGQCQVEDQPHG